MRHSLLIVALAVAVIATLGLGGCASGTDTGTTTPPSDGGTTDGGTGGTAPTMDAQVVISGFAFDPGSVEVAVGGTVTWTNEDSAAHTVDGPDWASGSLAQGDTFSQTFDTAGAFEYSCGVHPSMTGTVIVK